jgi:hypothetical protein
VAVSGDDMIVTLNPLNTNACLTVAVLDIDGLTGDADVSVILHAGDVNDDENANLLDLQAVKAALFGPLSSANFTADVNVDGAINLLDLQAVKGNLFQTVTCP